MYSLIGFGENIKNLYKLCLPYLDKDIKSVQDIRNPYLTFLERHQPNAPVNWDISYKIYDKGIENKLVKAYSDSELNDLKQDNLIDDEISWNDKKSHYELIDEGYEILCSHNPEVKQLFDLVVHSIFVRNSKTANGISKSYGGSASSAIGTTWISTNVYACANDYAEFLLHELTHHLVFLDERCYPQFNYAEMVKPENFAVSAILKMPRPLDKVVHSIIVGTEILLARKNFMNLANVRVHPTSSKLETNIKASINDVLDLDNLEDILRPRGIHLVSACRNAITNYREVA
ncbi:MAG: hypothetical protein ACI9CO_000012 [Candidatus Azotimanducaceae bacterium]|jgi:hypothetical protein